MIATAISFITGGGLFGIVSRILGMLPPAAWMALLAVGALWYARYDARQDAEAACEAANRAAEAALLEERSKASEAVSNASREAAEKYRTRINALKKELAKHETQDIEGDCPVSADFLNSLPTQRAD